MAQVRETNGQLQTVYRRFHRVVNGEYSIRLLEWTKLNWSENEQFEHCLTLTKTLCPINCVILHIEFMSGILHILENAKRNDKRLFSLLIDPDKTGGAELERTALAAKDAGVDLLFVGGSLLVNDRLFDTVQIIKANCDIPVVLFPGDNMQVVPNADAILLLSVISGRNAEMLIGKHVVAAPRLKNSGLEIIPTGYMLIDSGRPTTASYMSNTNPLPHDKDDIAACTAMAGEMLGMKTIFMDGGSGAMNAVSESMVKRVSQHVDVPLIVGGGLKTPEMAKARFDAGATVVVVGNAVEKNGSLLAELASAKF